MTVQAVQARGEVPHAIAWSQTPPPATIAAQFAHTFFSVLSAYGAAPNEAFSLASHVVQAHCTTLVDGAHVVPPLPLFMSELKAELPDNNSIPAIVYPGVEPKQSIASVVPGKAWVPLTSRRAATPVHGPENPSVTPSLSTPLRLVGLAATCPPGRAAVATDRRQQPRGQPQTQLSRGGTEGAASHGNTELDGEHVRLPLPIFRTARCGSACSRLTHACRIIAASLLWS